MTADPCPQCGASTVTRALPAAPHAAGPVEVEVRGLLQATCDAGHPYGRPTDPIAACRRAITDQVLHADRGGLRRRDTCGPCGASLDLPPRTTDVPVPFDADGVVVTVVLRAPMVRCPACGEQQVTRETAGLIDRALQASIEAARSG